MVRFTKIKLKGFLSASPSKGMAFNDLGHINVLIGPNNAGKSILSRMFLNLRGAKSFPNFKGYTTTKSSYWFKYDLSRPIEIDLSYTLSDSNAPVIKPDSGKQMLLDQTNWHTTYSINRPGQGGKNPFEVSADFRIGKNKFPHQKLITSAEEGLVTVSNLRTDGSYESTVSPNLVKAQEDATETILSRIVFFAAVRDFTQAGNTRAIDGSRVKAGLQQMTGADLEQLCQTLNLLLRPTGTNKIEELRFNDEPTAMKLSSPNHRLDQQSLESVFQCRVGELWLEPSAFGTGITQLLILLAEIQKAKNDSDYLIVFIEEPESHLHPALLSRLMAHFKQQKQIQFFISTHSSVLLDCIDEDYRIFRVSQSKNGVSSVSACKTFVDLHNVIDDLGISGNALLQANNVIWVEGPSDATYIKCWLEIAAAKKGVSLVQHADYAILNYGGSLIKYLSADDPKLSTLTNLLKICRRCVVIADKDIPNGKSTAVLKSSVRRLKSECDKDKRHRLFVTTLGREIENDIPLPVLRKALLKAFNLVKPYQKKISSIDFDGKSRLPNQVASKLWRAKTKQKAFIVRYDESKPRLANHVRNKTTEVFEKDVNAELYPSYIDEIVDFILKGRY